MLIIHSGNASFLQWFLWKLFQKVIPEMIGNLEKHTEELLQRHIRVFPGKSIDLNFVSLLGNILAKATFYTWSFIMVFLSLSKFFNICRELGICLCYFQDIEDGSYSKNIGESRIRNVIEMLILVISSISGLLARPLVINLGFPTQGSSEKFIWMNCSCELMFPSAFT